MLLQQFSPARDLAAQHAKSNHRDNAGHPDREAYLKEHALLVTGKLLPMQKTQDQVVIPTKEYPYFTICRGSQ